MLGTGYVARLPSRDAGRQMNPSLQKNQNLLEQLQRECSLDLVGVADVCEERVAFLGLPDNVQQSLPYAIVIALRVSRGVLSTLEDGPNLIYFHHYRQLNAQLDRAATKISAEIERQGCLALPIPASQIVDWEKMAGHLSHRAIGHLAGLGWIGRNNLLVTSQFGAQIRLATIITDLPLSVAQPMKATCGTCCACLAVCPAKAIKEEAADFDREACYQQLREFSKTRRIGQHICGLCVKACLGSAGIVQAEQ
jgi:epoxyqueuosine reductase